MLLKDEDHGESRRCLDQVLPCAIVVSDASSGKLQY